MTGFSCYCWGLLSQRSLFALRAVGLLPQKLVASAPRYHFKKSRSVTGFSCYCWGLLSQRSLFALRGVGLLPQKLIASAPRYHFKKSRSVEAV
ncbi:hypothetical protein [Marinobacter sp. SS21]|uniref:hypothetical protein n=1 Tax=Marinobacter sp. SS21 TaxID=2979460 RepID=UPI002330612D|nr:hypothetical protein [Marinobacter sp. SS21]MDC0663862.1 hypothetical protein [Marinobacter sp. SS21]